MRKKWSKKNWGPCVEVSYEWSVGSGIRNKKGKWCRRIITRISLPFVSIPSKKKREFQNYLKWEIL